MTQKTGLRRAGVLLLALAMLAAACGDDDGATDATDATGGADSGEQPGEETAPDGGEPIEFTIGELTIVEGALADGVKSHQNALAMAVEDINAEGVVHITVERGDVGDTPDTALAGLQEIADSDPLAVVGAPLSPQTNALGGALADADIIHLAPNAIAVKDFGPLAFNVFPPFVDYQVEPALDTFVEMFGDELESAFYVSASDYPVGVAVNDLRKEVLEEERVTTVGDEKVLQADTDFLTLATKIAQANPSVVIEDTLSSIVLLRQIRDAGYEGLIFGGSFVSNGNFLVPSQGAYEGAYTYHPWLTEPRENLSVTGQNFVERYEAEFGSLPDAFAAGIYDGVRLLADAVAEVGSADDPETIAETMLALSLDEGVTASPLAFDADRVLPMSPLLVQVKGTEYVPAE